MKTALTIAGSDPTGGAGLQADLKVFKSFDIQGLSVLSAITAQNTIGVASVYPVEDVIVEKQMETILSDIDPDAIKTGMVYSSRNVEIIARMLSCYPCSNLVIDPVSISSSGMSLVENGTLNSLRERLFRLARIVTPNIYEASLLSGISITSPESMQEAAKSLKHSGPEAVVITGGHLEDRAMDCFYDGSFHFLEKTKQKGEYHGTGCAFSAAVAALLALGYSTIEAVKGAKDFVSDAISRARHHGKGMGLLSL